MKVGIVGYGHVGKYTKALFTTATVYDEPLHMGSRDEINACDTAFICVPTPMAEDGHCDTSIVENVLSWLTTRLVIICSTVYVGFTDKMMAEHQREIVFQPEYYGETAAHPFATPQQLSWLTFGGTPAGIALAIETYQQVINAETTIHQVPAKVAEMAKYMENAFLATKVMFCNEMYDIAEKLGVDYNLVREVWTADPRIGKSHTFVYPNRRGFSGSCLPKDVSSLLSQAKAEKADASLLATIIHKNREHYGNK